MEMNGLPAVTNENYFSPEVEMAYMGSSQVKGFMACEAAELARLQGRYERPVTTALLVGGYVDAYFEGSLDKFQGEHPEIFNSRTGALKADYKQANDIIAKMEADELYMLLMSGRKQVVKTGEIAGVPFKIKIDSLLDAADCERIRARFPRSAAALGFCAGAIVDQKAMRQLSDVWDGEERRMIPFVEAWGYDIQGAIYQAVEGHMLPFILAVGTKEDTPDLAALYIDDADLNAKLMEVEDVAPRFQAIKEGKIPPRRCERCAYCKATRKLDRIVNYKELSEC